MRILPVAAVVLLLVACDPGRPATAPPRASPTPSATPVLRPPAQAILADAGLGPAAAASDHVTPEELAAAAPDQVLALQDLRGWGWLAGSRRTWAAGARSVDVLVVLTARDEGAVRAYRTLAARTALAPLSTGPCPAAISGLDACALGTGAGRSTVAGRLGTEVFLVDAVGVDAAPLAARQAAMLRG